jgi:hypothetical protein
MHRYIIKAKEGELVDHINNQKDDNRSCNLRIASSNLNNHNRIKKKKTSSKYIGVTKSGKKWQSNITYKGVNHYLGRFEDEIDAAKAYNKKAIELYKSDANLNVFDDQEEAKISSNV